MTEPSGTDGDGPPERSTSGRPVPEERIAELEAQVERLRREVEPPRGPLGLPRPPTPGELLRFADEHAIPTAIAVLEANVRALKALREALRLLRRVEDRDPRDGAGSIRDRTDSLAREAIEEFDRAITDLAEAVEGDGLPDDAEARSVLREARAVREEVASALGAGEGTGEMDGTAEDGTDRTAADDAKAGEGGTEIDVEAELDSIREEVRGERSDDDKRGNDGDNGG